MTAPLLLNPGPVTLSAAVRAAQIAKSAGATVSFDPASYQMIREMGHDRFLRATSGLPVDILFPNRDEGEALTGEREPVAIAGELRQMFPGALVALKLDSDGCFVAGDGHAQHYPTAEAKAVDTTGAGDAFHGAFAAGLSAGMGWEELLRYASGVGALCCTKRGARIGIPTGAEVRAFLQEHNHQDTKARRSH